MAPAVLIVVFRAFALFQMADVRPIGLPAELADSLAFRALAAVVAGLEAQNTFVEAHISAKASSITSSLGAFR